MQKTAIEKKLLFLQKKIMKQFTSILLIFLFFTGSAVAQNKNVKNVIVLIPDGTSLSVVSAARWYQRCINPEKPNLNIDPYICGTVLSYSSNAPIGDSAPTTSAYMTGYTSRAGSVSMYSPADQKNDIIPLDPEKAYQPLMTIMEAARISQKKSTGLVFTCEFAHATPADCASHTYNRSKYEWIVPQMVHNKLDVVIGGGVSLLTEQHQQFLKEGGYSVFLDDLKGFRDYQKNQMWALFGNMDMAYDIDRDPEKQPSMAEMTKKAIELLSKNKNGFFLMVEGSKIDWAAHGNDAVATITEMLAFDKACGVALDFAKKDGKTVVLVVPDHGTGGFSIGSNNCPNYSSLTKDELFGKIAKFKTSVGALESRIKQIDPTTLKDFFNVTTGITLSDEDYNKLLVCADYRRSSIPEEDRTQGLLLSRVIAEIVNKNICFGFTTTGHTGEELFLAIYDPTKSNPTGHKTNIELNLYLQRIMGLKQNLDLMTKFYFAKHTDVFTDYLYNIANVNNMPVLEVKNKNNVLEITPNTSITKLNGKEIDISSVIIHVDRNNTFYLPQSLRDLLR